MKKRFAWFVAATLGISVSALPIAAQTKLPPRLEFTAANEVSQAGHFRRLQQPCPCPPGQILPSDPGKQPSPEPGTTPSPTPAPTDNVPSFGGYKSSFGQGTPISAGSGIGGAVASAAAGLPIPQANARSATLTTNGTPLILPGLLTTTGAQNAVPLDRVFFDYGYFNRMFIASPTGPIAGYNLNTFAIGIEKTFLDGNASIYVSVPFLDATQNISGQAIDGLGNINAGFKYLLWSNRDTGSALAAGLTVSAPTGRDTVATNTLNVTFTGGTQPSVVPNPPPVGTILTFTETTRINPTYFQPYAAGLWVADRFFFHEYFGVIVPTDGRVATFINNNLTMGYNIYENRGSFLTSITPTFGVQLLLPVNHVNNSASPTTTVVPANITCIGPFPTDQLPGFDSLGFPSQVFLNAGAQFGLGERALLSAGVVVPVAGPRGYEIGVSVGLSYLY